MSPKLRLLLPFSAPSPSPPRNSFTATDYYRETRDETYSPMSLAFSAANRYPEVPQLSPIEGHLPHIHEGHDPDVPESEEEKESVKHQLANRTSLFLLVFHLLFHKWRRQKNGRKSKDS